MWGRKKFNRCIRRSFFTVKNLIFKFFKSFFKRLLYLFHPNFLNPTYSFKIPKCFCLLTLFFFLVCGKRYKNSQGLRYHYEHYNHDQEEPPPAPIVAPPQQVEPQPPPMPDLTAQQPVLERPPPNHVSGAKRAKGTPPSNFCDVL